MIGFDDFAVILQRSDGELGAFPIEKLSAADLDYLKSEEAKGIHSSNIGEVQTWNITNGMKVTGRIVDYAQRDVTVQSRRGKTYVNNIVFENLPQIYQYMLPMIVEHLEPTGEIDKRGFKKWVRELKGEAKTFKLSGVLFELENGDEYGVPFFLFAEGDQKLLKPGWDVWIQKETENAQADAHEAFMLQSAAAAYKQQQDAYQQCRGATATKRSVSSTDRGHEFELPSHPSWHHISLGDHLVSVTWKPLPPAMGGGLWPQ